MEMSGKATDTPSLSLAQTLTDSLTTIHASSSIHVYTHK